MAQLQHPTILHRQRQSRLKQLAHVGPFLAASLVERAIRCGRPRCHCATGQKGHPSWYATWKPTTKTVTLYLPPEALPEASAWVKEYHEVKRLLREISMLSWQILHAKARVRRAQRTRRR